MKNPAAARRVAPALIAALGLLLPAGVISADAARAATPSKARLYACAKKSGGSLRLVGRKTKCRRSERKVSWNVAGDQGAQGPRGVAGLPGTTGPTGPQGLPGVTNIVTGVKDLTLNAPGLASLFSISVPAMAAAGGTVDYTIVATDAGSQIATEHGRIQWLATANSITCNVDATDKLHLGTVGSGCTPGFFNPGSRPGISIYDNVSFPSPAAIATNKVYFTIQNDSPYTIRLEP